jgi:hypothetical protein
VNIDGHFLMALEDNAESTIIMTTDMSIMCALVLQISPSYVLVCCSSHVSPWIYSFEAHLSFRLYWRMPEEYIYSSLLL